MSENSSQMVELGAKWECWSCGAKFYDLGKTAPVCPKCGSNQLDKDAPPEPEETSEPAPPAKEATKKATKKTAKKKTAKKKKAKKKKSKSGDDEEE